MYVYALGDPRTQEIRYVGIAKDVYKRYAQHLISPHSNDTKNAWMAELKASSIIPTITILESDVDESIIYMRERHWIAQYLELGAPLTNITHGMIRRRASDRPIAVTSSRQEAINQWDKHRAACHQCKRGQYAHPPDYCEQGTSLLRQMAAWKTRRKYTRNIKPNRVRQK